MGILRADRFSPTLFIGLGGSGSRVVNAIAGKLRRHPNWGRFRDLIHTVCIDTNKADLHAQKNVPDTNRFLISAFDRRAYVERKRGRQELREDRMLTQWVHPDYQFRDAQGAGAGQIRVESRLGLYYNLEEDRAGMVRSIQRMLDAATRPDSPYRDNEDRVIQALIFASVAGGTGSGGFLPVAYLLQDMIRDHGWGRPNVVATLMLPSIFTSDVEQALHADINANGYAALKELEFVTKLGYERCVDKVEFHYDPTHPERTHITNRPFSLCYLVDKPSELSVEKYTNAIADSAFLQVFSPIVGAQAGEYDNYDKHQKTLALGHFSVHYGSFGAAVLVLPRADILHYATLRYVARVMDSYLVFGRDESFRVPYGDPKFQRLAQEEKDRIVDEKYVQFVEHHARLEEDRQEKGSYTAIVAQKGTDGSSLRDIFRRKLDTIFGGLDEQLQIQPFDPLQVHEGNTSLARSVDNLRRDVASSRERVLGSYLQSQLADLKSGRFFSEFFRGNKVGPLAQRFLLIKLKGEGPLTPFEDPAEGAFLHETRENAYDIEKEHVKRELGELEKRLQTTSRKGFLSSVLSRENKEFDQVRRKTQDMFSQVENGQRDWLKVSFWQSFHEELQRSVEARLTAFRNVSSIADEKVRDIQSEAERLHADPSSRGEASDAAAFYLDSEVLRDDRAGKRLWDRLFAQSLDRPAYYDEGRIFEAIGEAFEPGIDDQGRVRAKDAMEIVRDVRARLEDQARSTLGRALEEQGFDLRTALEMEARFVIATKAGRPDAAGFDAVTEPEIREHVRDKFRRLSDQCVLLANIDRTKLDDPTVTPADVFYVGLSPRYAGDEANSLKSAVRMVATGVDFIDGWSEDDIVVFYRALLGVPLYFYRRVNDELYHAYRTVKAKPNRSYPLHIESAWEDGIPNLHPKEIRDAEEKRRAEDEARARLVDREERIWSFVLATLAGRVERTPEGGYAWVVGSVKKTLAGDRGGSFEAFWALDAALRDDLVAAGKQAAAERNSTVPARRVFRGELERYLLQVNELFAVALRDEDERSARYLKEEKRVVEEHLSALPAS
ncbi:MAG: hypothetical protein EXR73_11100 [Myxococcales bacterium]|nr:hypothetical protein [Myxococcales bacterium]